MQVMMSFEHSQNTNTPNAPPPLITARTSHSHELPSVSATPSAPPLSAAPPSSHSDTSPISLDAVLGVVPPSVNALRLPSLDDLAHLSGFATHHHHHQHHQHPTFEQALQAPPSASLAALLVVQEQLKQKILEHQLLLEQHEHIERQQHQHHLQHQHLQHQHQQQPFPGGHALPHTEDGLLSLATSHPGLVQQSLLPLYQQTRSPLQVQASAGSLASPPLLSSPLRSAGGLALSKSSLAHTTSPTPPHPFATSTLAGSHGGSPLLGSPQREALVAPAEHTHYQQQQLQLQQLQLQLQQQQLIQLQQLQQLQSRQQAQQLQLFQQRPYSVSSLPFDSSGLGIAHVATTESPTSISTTYQYRSNAYSSGKKRKASKPGRFDCKVPGCGKKYNSSGGIRYHLRHCNHEGMEQTPESLEQLHEVMEKERAAHERIEKLREAGISSGSPARDDMGATPLSGEEGDEGDEDYAEVSSTRAQQHPQRESWPSSSHTARALDLPLDLPNVPVGGIMGGRLQTTTRASEGAAGPLLPREQRSPPRLSHPASPYSSTAASSPDKAVSNMTSQVASPRESVVTVPEFTDEHARLLELHEAQLRQEAAQLRDALMGITTTTKATGTATSTGAASALSPQRRRDGQEAAEPLSKKAKDDVHVGDCEAKPP